MSTQVVDLVRDSTMQKMQAELVAVHKASVLASGSTAAIDQMYNALVNNASTVAEVNGLFVQWWRANWTEGTTTRNELLERWFGTVLDDDRVHGVKFPLFPTSETAIGELTDDSARLTCTPSTETTAEQDDFAHLPQFWSVLVAAEKAQTAATPSMPSSLSTAMTRYAAAHTCAGRCKKIHTPASGTRMVTATSKCNAAPPQAMTHGRRALTARAKSTPTSQPGLCSGAGCRR